MKLKILLLASALAVCAFGTVYGYQVSAWTFGDASSLAAAADRAAVDEINVDWYTSKADGSVKATTDENLLFVSSAQARGLRVFATVSNWSNNDFDADLAKTILASKKSQAKHVKAITNLCVKQGYDGVDLDWESLHPSDKNRFSGFVKKLAKKLHHAGKSLSIAVHPKESEPGNWDGPKAQDWAALGAVVDEFKVMTYDYSGSWSDPGPISPPSWADAVLTHAESLVPVSKIMMGVPYYGYDWLGSSTTDLEWKDANALISLYHPTVTHDVSGEATFQYVDGGSNSRIVFFQDRSAITAKFQMLLTNHPSIRGIAIWRMGGEDTAFWDQIVLQLR